MSSKRDDVFAFLRVATDNTFLNKIREECEPAKSTPESKGIDATAERQLAELQNADDEVGQNPFDPITAKIPKKPTRRSSESLKKLIEKFEPEVSECDLLFSLDPVRVEGSGFRRGHHVQDTGPNVIPGRIQNGGEPKNQDVQD